MMRWRDLVKCAVSGRRCRGVPYAEADVPITPMRYYSPVHHAYFVLSDVVVRTFSTSRQHLAHQPEVGGQLFGAFQGNDVMVEVATVTPPRSGKWRHFFHPDRGREQRDIEAQFAAGRHYVGDWHTHPEARPTPSSKDLSTMRDCFAKSKHELTAFLQVIVGLQAGPAGLWVGVHNEKTFSRLEISDARPSSDQVSRDQNSSEVRDDQ
jgi:integrative and conjugative element protein (TIGR02256 family)